MNRFSRRGLFGVVAGGAFLVHDLLTQAAYAAVGPAIYSDALATVRQIQTFALMVYFNSNNLWPTQRQIIAAYQEVLAKHDQQPALANTPPGKIMAKLNLNSAEFLPGWLWDYSFKGTDKGYVFTFAEKDTGGKRVVFVADQTGVINRADQAGAILPAAQATDATSYPGMIGNIADVAAIAPKPTWRQ